MNYRQFRSNVAWRFRRMLLWLPISRIAHYFFRNRPLAEWPAWVGVLCDIKLPRRSVPSAKRLPITSGSANIQILFQLIKRTANIQGDIAECGVFRGETLVPIALFVNELRLNKQVFGFDSFEGFGDLVTADLPLGGTEEPDKTEQGFSRTSLAFVQHKVDAFKLGPRATLKKGFFRDSLPFVEGRRFSFVHLDCDLYDSYRACLEFFYPRMAKGGIILLDEYNDPPWPGCNKAVDEFLADKPEKVVEILHDHFQKYFISKE